MSRPRYSARQYGSTRDNTQSSLPSARAAAVLRRARSLRRPASARDQRAISPESSRQRSSGRRRTEPSLVALSIGVHGGRCPGLKKPPRGGSRGRYSTTALGQRWRVADGGRAARGRGARTLAGRASPASRRRRRCSQLAHIHARREVPWRGGESIRAGARRAGHVGGKTARRREWLHGRAGESSAFPSRRQRPLRDRVLHWLDTPSQWSDAWTPTHDRERTHRVVS